LDGSLILTKVMLVLALLIIFCYARKPLSELSCFKSIKYPTTPH